MRGAEGVKPHQNPSSNGAQPKQSKAAPTASAKEASLRQQRHQCLMDRAGASRATKEATRQEDSMEIQWTMCEVPAQQAASAQEEWQIQPQRQRDLGNRSPGLGHSDANDYARARCQPSCSGPLKQEDQRSTEGGEDWSQATARLCKEHNFRYQ